MYFRCLEQSVGVTVLLGSLVLAQQASPGDKGCAQPVVVSDPTYRPGQVWSYKARPGESSSTVTILRVETLPKLGVIVHVRIDGVRFKNCTGGPAPTTVQHAPFAKEAINKSVLRQLTTVPVPEFEASYNEWLEHCGGAYTITVVEVVAVDDTTFNAGLGCQK